jgi:hypothetical protein
VREASHGGGGEVRPVRREGVRMRVRARRLGGGGDARPVAVDDTRTRTAVTWATVASSEREERPRSRRKRVRFAYYKTTRAPDPVSERRPFRSVASRSRLANLRLGLLPEKISGAVAVTLRAKREREAEASAFISFTF